MPTEIAIKCFRQRAMKKRWDFITMMSVGQKLFASIHRKKRMAHANHDVHLLARTSQEWLPQGI